MTCVPQGCYGPEEFVCDDLCKHEGAPMTEQPNPQQSAPMEPFTTWGVLRDPAIPEGVVVARSSRDSEWIGVAFFSDWASNADIAQAIADALNRAQMKGAQMREHARIGRRTP